jgi:hypothetical protein
LYSISLNVAMAFSSLLRRALCKNVAGSVKFGQQFCMGIRKARKAKPAKLGRRLP